MDVYLRCLKYKAERQYSRYKGFNDCWLDLCTYGICGKTSELSMESENWSITMAAQVGWK